ncbi:MAG: exonuclease domain-containing protein [Lachnospiraceae bacterium]|nr:exonuclease domain-containing protein [Lachnospiraceae bacterium]
MNYIVFDLEWNQSNTGLEEEVSRLPFEIIEIGAIKLNDTGVMVSEFNEIVKPQVYHEMHHITSKLIHMQMKELERGEEFPQVFQKFMDWCGEEEYIFCTWGSLDLTELQRNMKFYELTPLSDKPIAFLDVQKLFSIAFEDRKQRRALEYAIDFLKLDKDIPFHRAFSDAYYTTKILVEILQNHVEVIDNVSYDVFNPPTKREDEVKVQFDTYMKYISRKFDDKAAAFADKEVISTKCYICHRNLRKKIRWFTSNMRHYYAVAYCDKHGYLKGKIRVRKSDDGKIFVVKTTKFISKEDMDDIVARKAHAKEARKKRRSKGNRDCD